MRCAKQLSIRLSNKPGRLANVLAAFAKDKVAIGSLVVMDSGDHGTVRMVPEDVAVAKGTLDGLNVEYDEVDVLLVDVPNRAGAFRNICRQLAAEHLNIDYAYGSHEAVKGSHLAVIRVNDLAKAQRVLAEAAAGNGRTRRQPVRRPGRKG
jgi:hypothetical protein